MAQATRKRAQGDNVTGARGAHRVRRKPEKRVSVSHARARKRPQPWTAEVEARFLEALAQCGIVADGLKAANVERSTVEKRRQKNAGFAAACAQAIEASNDILLASLWGRGVEGQSRSYMRRGELIEEKQYDTPAAHLIMRQRFPQLFGRLEVTGKDGREIIIKVVE